MDSIDTTEGRAKPAGGVMAGGPMQRAGTRGDSVPVLLTKLAKKASTGDKKALKQLLSHKEFQQRLERICRWLCWRYPHKFAVSDPQDLRQEVNLKILKTITQFRAESSILTYVRHIAHNIHAAQLRRERMENGYTAAHRRSPHEEASTELELRALLSVEVRKLNNVQQYVLRRNVEGATLKDIAEELSCSISKVQSVLKQAQQRLVKSV